MKYFTKYNLATGEILGTGECIDDHFDLQAGDGEALIEDRFSPVDYYIQESIPVARPELIVVASTSSINADGVEVATISGLPNPTEVELSGVKRQKFQVLDGVIELVTTTPGRYAFLLKAFPYKDKEIIIHAT